MIKQEYVNGSWNQVKRFWTQLNLDNPRIYAKEEKEGLGEEIACFDILNKQIYVDEKNLEERLGVYMLRPVLNHEAGHHKMCPYGLRNFVRLVAHANKETKNIELAKLTENLFADILINTHLYKKGERAIKEVYKKFSIDNSSRVWKFYISTFEHMLNEPYSILKEQPSKDIKNDAKRLSNILSEVIYSSAKWPKSIREFAKCIKKYMDEGKKDKSQSDNKKLLIDEHQAKDFLPSASKMSKKQKAKIVEKEIKGLAKEVGISNFKKIIAGLGVGTRTQSKIWFYRDLVSDFLLEMPRAYIGIKTSTPRVPERWRISDPPEWLNIEYSLSNFGVLIPNITTHQLVSKKYDQNIIKGESPDLAIIIDSSVSMPNPNKCISFPVLSAMLAANTALEHGKKVAVINYAVSYKKENFTNNRDKIDEVISYYLNEGTIIPGRAIRDLVSKHDYPTHLLIISDTEISNLTDEIENLEYSLKKAKAGGTIFIDCNPSKKTKQLSDIGFDVQFTRSFEDLSSLTLNKARSLYDPLFNGCK